MIPVSLQAPSSCATGRQAQVRSDSTPVPANCQTAGTISNCVSTASFPRSASDTQACATTCAKSSQAGRPKLFPQDAVDAVRRGSPSRREGSPAPPPERLNEEIRRPGSCASSRTGKAACDSCALSRSRPSRTGSGPDDHTAPVRTACRHSGRGGPRGEARRAWREADLPREDADCVDLEVKT